MARKGLTSLCGWVKYQRNGRMQLLYLCTKVGRSLRRIRWVIGQYPWPPAWPGFLRKPSTYKSESISRWTNWFMIISLVFYRSTPQLPNCATWPTNGQWLWIKVSAFKRLSWIWARHTTGCPLQACFLSSLGVGSLCILWNGWTRFWQIAGRELKLEICTPSGLPFYVESLKVQCWDQHFSWCSLMTCQLILWGDRLFLQMTLTCFPVEIISWRRVKL